MTVNSLFNFLVALIISCVIGMLVFFLVFCIASYISSLNADPRYPTMPLGEAMLGIGAGIITGICSLILLFRKLQRRDRAKATSNIIQ